MNHDADQQCSFSRSVLNGFAQWQAGALSATTSKAARLCCSSVTESCHPADELAAILDQTGFVKGRPVIIQCDGGGRAALAALATSGFPADTVIKIT